MTGFDSKRQMAALRTALEQPEQEPVRMPCVGKDPRCPCQDGDACHYKDCGNTKARPVPQAEPPPEWPLIKNILAVFGLDAIAFVAKWKAAQQQAEPVLQRKPLTDELVYKLWDDKYRSWIGGEQFESIARAIERAHNIKEQP